MSEVTGCEIIGRQLARCHQAKRAESDLERNRRLLNLTKRRDALNKKTSRNTFEEMDLQNLNGYLSAWD